MRSYRTLDAWKRAHAIAFRTIQITDQSFHPRARALFDQLKRAAISIEANIVEGYALNTPGLCRRHLRIAIGSAAEAECLARLASEVGYIDPTAADELERLLDSALGALHGLMRRLPITTP
jgi:four helix bundle protein